MMVSDAVAAALEIDCSGAAVSALTPEMAMRPAPNLQLTHQYTGDDSLADLEPLANTNPRLSISPGMRPDGWGFGWIPPSHLETGAGASALPASLRRVAGLRKGEPVERQDWGGMKFQGQILILKKVEALGVARE